MVARPARLSIAACAALALIAILAGCGGDGPGTPVALAPGASVVGGPGVSDAQPPWPAEYAKLPQRLRILGIPRPGTEKFHVHQQLRIYDDGLLVPVPKEIGLQLKQDVASAVHTHDGSGVVHIEADNPITVTLGDLFGVWGVAFGPDHIGGLRAEGDRKLHVFVNGREIEDPATHVLAKDDNIVVAFGSLDGVPTRPDTTALDKADDGEALCSAKSKDGKPPKSCLVTPEGTN